MKNQELEQKIENLFQEALDKVTEIYDLAKNNIEITPDMDQDDIEDAKCDARYDAEYEMRKFIRAMSDNLDLGWSTSSLSC